MYPHGGNYPNNVYSQLGINNNRQNNINNNNIYNQHEQKSAPPIIQKKVNPNQKYANLEIETFFDDGRNNNYSQKDVELMGNLDAITKQYTSIFNEINELSSHFSGGNDDTYKLNNIKKELDDLDNYNASEYGKFISELFDISKDDKVLNLDYKKYKLNPQDADEKLKKVISDFKYDCILSVNKNNSQENIQKIKNYINEKKNGGKNNNNSQYDNRTNNQNSQYGFGGSIYEGQNNSNKQSYNIGNSIYGNNPKYENPNEYGNYNNINDYTGKSIYGNNNYSNPNQVDSYYNKKIKVTFVYQGNRKIQEYDPNEKAYLLYYYAMELKDDPKIYNKNGKSYSYDELKDLSIGKFFQNMEPTLNVY